MNKSRLIRVVVGAGAMAALLLPASVASAGSISSGPLTLTVKDSPFLVKGTQETLDGSYCDGIEVIEGGTVRQAMSASIARMASHRWTWPRTTTTTTRDRGRTTPRARRR